MLLGADNLSTQIPDNIKKQAEEVYNDIQSKVMPKVETFKNSVTIDNTTGAMVFMDNPPAEGGVSKDKDKSGENILSKYERLYIFISSSMPMSLLERYSKDIDALGLGGSAIFIIRGCVPTGGLAGCGDFKKTLDFVRSFVMKGSDEGRQNSLWIDPILFKKYAITEVPAFVYAKNVTPLDDMGSEGDYSRLQGEPTWWKSIGDWSFDYHLKELYEKSGEGKMKKLAERK